MNCKHCGTPLFPGIGNVFNCGSVLGSPKRTNRCIQTEKIAGPIRDERDALQARVKRLEDALSAADKYLCEIQADDSDYDTWICNTADARTAYAFAKQAAKESKP